MRINKEFRIVFQPKDRVNIYGRRRFGVGAGSLYKYVGLKNANVAIRRALESGLDKYRVRLRKHGIIDFYSK